MSLFVLLRAIALTSVCLWPLNPTTASAQVTTETTSDETTQGGETDRSEKPAIESDVDPEVDLDLQSLRKVWKTIEEVHWDRDLIAERWADILPEYEAKLGETESGEEARAVIAAMISRLGQSHFGIIPASVYERQAELGIEKGNGSLGMAVRWLDGELVVTRVRQAGPAAQAGIQTGDRIDQIRGKTASEIAERAGEAAQHEAGRAETFTGLIAEAMLGGPVAETVDLAWTDSTGKAHQQAIELAQSVGDFATFGNLPAVEVILESEVRRGGVLVYRFTSFFNPLPAVMEMKKLMEEQTEAKGLVFDVRGNRGGIILMASALCNWLTTEPTLFGVMKMSDSELKLRLNPRKPHFAGRVVVLVDDLSISSAEILAGGLRDAGMATIIGTQTAGLVLPSMVSTLPNGDRFQFAISDFTTGNGTRLEGDGVVPDIVVKPTRASLAGGRDPIMDAAIEWIEMNSDKSAPETTPKAANDSAR